MTKNNALLLIFIKRAGLIFIFSIFLVYFLTIVSKQAFACRIYQPETLVQTANSEPQGTYNFPFHEDFESFSLSQWKQAGDWEVTQEGKISGTYSLKHLVKPVAGESSLFHTLKADWSALDIEWSFRLKNGNWDPSGSNRFWFYLSADTILKDLINGWAVGVNLHDNTDLLELWRIQNGKPDSLIIQTDFDWNASTLATISAKRSSLGYWTLSYQKEGEALSNAFTGTDLLTFDFTTIGLYFQYTYTRSGQLWMDDISIKATTAGLHLQKLAVVNSNTLLLAFNKPVNPSSIANENFHLTDENNLQVPILQITPAVESSQMVEMKIDPPLGINLTLNVSGVSDLSGQRMEPESLTVAFSFSPEPGSVLINEVLFNPLTGGADFVELVNVSPFPIDAHRLRLAARNDTMGLKQVYALRTASRYVQPKHFLTCTKDSQAVFPFYFSADPQTVCIMNSFPSYPDDMGSVVLLNDSLQVIDEFAYTAKMHSPFLTNKNGVSLERISTTKPTTDPTNWASAASSAGFATPGLENSQAITHTQDVDEIIPEPIIFSPNGDGTNDQVTIRFRLIKPGYMANVRIFDIAGRPVKYLVKNESIALQGAWTWKGDSDSGQRLSMGVYIILVELYDSHGNTRTFKKTCTISDWLY